MVGVAKDPTRPRPRPGDFFLKTGSSMEQTGVSDQQKGVRGATDATITAGAQATKATKVRYVQP